MLHSFLHFLHLCFFFICRFDGKHIKSGESLAELTRDIGAFFLSRRAARAYNNKKARLKSCLVRVKSCADYALDTVADDGTANFL